MTKIITGFIAGIAVMYFTMIVYNLNSQNDNKDVSLFLRLDSRLSRFEKKLDMITLDISDNIERLNDMLYRDDIIIEKENNKLMNIKNNNDGTYENDYSDNQWKGIIEKPIEEVLVLCGMTPYDKGVAPLILKASEEYKYAIKQCKEKCKLIRESYGNMQHGSPEYIASNKDLQGVYNELDKEKERICKDLQNKLMSLLNKKEND